MGVSSSQRTRSSLRPLRWIRPVPVTLVRLSQSECRWLAFLTCARSASVVESGRPRWVNRSRSRMPNILLLRTAGTNCDRELAHAFTLAGAKNVSTLHINKLLDNPAQFADYQILAFPGGFSYGDDIASGKILANQLIHHLKAPLQQF